MKDEVGMMNGECRMMNGAPMRLAMMAALLVTLWVPAAWAAKAAPRARSTAARSAKATGASVSGSAKRVPAVTAAAKSANGSVPKRMADWSAANTGGLWRTMEKNQETCEAFLTGNWADVASGKIAGRDFRKVSPPDLGAALGLATVYGPDTAGWFVSGGRRVNVQTTDAARGNTTLSYESLARLGWATGVAADAPYCARIVWGAPSSTGAMPLRDFCARVIESAPRTGAWLVAGLVELSMAEGRSLRRSPVGCGLDAGSYGMSWGEGQRVLLVVLLVDPKSDSESAQALRKGFFAAGAPAQGGLLLRAHYAVFSTSPGPHLDTTQPFQAAWTARTRSEILNLPKVSGVCEATEGTRVGRAYVSVYALKTVAPYHLYPEPELMDPTEKDPTILVEQRLATKNNPLGVPIYDRPRVLLRKPVAEAILRISQRAQQKGYRLKIYDAYRPLSVSQRLYLKFPEASRSGYLAVPNIGSRHNRGAALDLTLTDSKGREIEMPSDYLTFDGTSHRTTPKMSAAARRNMETLTALMASEGFTTINEEWWHYDAPNWERYPVMDEPLWPEKDIMATHGPALPSLP
jgi:zinc D-Ala-D-Ala dipeptidase